MMKNVLILAVAGLLAACNAPPPAEPASPAAGEPAGTPAAAAATTVAPAKPASKADFADRVWKVSASNGVQTGSTYAFLRNGTLVVDSPAGSPMYGSWSYEGGKLTMSEQGQSYPTDILQLDAATFRIRSHNPGQAVDITLVPAPDEALPPDSPPQDPLPQDQPPAG